MYVMRIVVVLTAVTGALCGCVPAPSSRVFLDGAELEVFVADEPEEWGRGLQGYDELEQGEGMLFRYDDAEVREFAMRGVTFSLDVVFIAEDGTVSAIEPLDPGDNRIVRSPGPAPYALELPQGWAEERGIGIGSELQLDEASSD